MTGEWQLVLYKTFLQKVTSNGYGSNSVPVFGTDSVISSINFQVNDFEPQPNISVLSFLVSVRVFQPKQVLATSNLYVFLFSIENIN